jgi:hypothetical protein
MLGIPFSLLYIIKSTHVYEPKFWRFEEKFWTVLADYSQNTRLPTQVLMTYQLVIDFLKTGT